MDADKRTALLRMFYAAALADSALRLGNEGVLERTTAAKREEQLKSGKTRAQQLGVETPAEVFGVLADIFGCANWRVDHETGSFTAVATSCVLCGIARKIGAESPCRIHCLDPMEGMVRGVSPNAAFRVESTLWTGDSCRVVVTEHGNEVSS